MTSASMQSLSMTASTPSAEFRAAGTDISERRRSGVSRGPLIDIAPSPDSIGMAWGADGTVRIGALTTIAAIAADTRIEFVAPRPSAPALRVMDPTRCSAQNGDAPPSHGSVGRRGRKPHPFG